MSESGRPFGVICHEPWTLVEADLVRGRTLTSWLTLPTDCNAGGTWVDERVHADSSGLNVLLGSREPDDRRADLRRRGEQHAEPRS
jgi:protease I